MIKQCRLAYLAGVIDSDGTIGIKKSTYSMRILKDATQPTFSERVSVRQVFPVVIDLLKEQFGGSRYMTRASSPNGRNLHAWTTTDLKAAACLKMLLPFLRIKREQALNALELRRIKDLSKKDRVRFGRGHEGAAKRNPALSSAMETLYEQAKRLNRVGR